MKTRADLLNIKCCVIKIGSAVLTDDGRGLNRAAINHWVEQISDLKARGIKVVVVSSGSVAEGMVRLGWIKRPHALHELQAAASVGQMGLIQAYEQSFQEHGSKTAQVLLTHDDLADRTRYLNARVTIKTLLGLSVVPIINENDVVANDELRVGDNDTLAAMVANLIEADLLIVLTDQAGFFDSDPRKNSAATLYSEIRADDMRLGKAASSTGGALGRGGMFTKLMAARMAARSGTATAIAPGLQENIIIDIVEGKQVGSLLTAGEGPIPARKRWLSGHLQVKGQLMLDEGAVAGIAKKGGSLLAIGVTGVTGLFSRGDLVSCVDMNGLEVARGLVNYNSSDAILIKQKKSTEIESVLGFVEEPELIHRDNLALI